MEVCLKDKALSETLVGRKKRAGISDFGDLAKALDELWNRARESTKNLTLSEAVAWPGALACGIYSGVQNREGCAYSLNR